MKEDHRKNKKTGWLILGAAVVLAVVGAALFLWKIYKDGELFDPELFANSQDIKENQVIFPGEEDYASDETGSGDSDLWERDKEAEDKIQPDELPDASVLFEMEKRLIDDPKEADHIIADMNHHDAVMNENEDDTLVPDGADEQPGKEDSQDSVIVPGEPEDTDKENNGPVVPGGETESGDSSHGGGQGGDGESEGESSGGKETESESNTTDTGESETGETEPEEPEKPLVDPDPEPELPPDIYEDFYGPTPSFPEEGIPEEEGSSEGDGPQYVLEIIKDPWETEHAGSIYYGCVLTDWKILCSVYAYVMEDGFPVYRLENYSDNFKIGPYPEVAKEDFSVTFYFRPNGSSDWQEVVCEFTVKPNKVLLQGKQPDEYLHTFYPNVGDTINLVEYYSKLLPEECVDIFGGGAPLPVLFPGWSETPGGPPVGITYTSKTPGRHVLYALPAVKLSDEYTAYLEMDWGIYFPAYLQTLTGYSGDKEKLVVPLGIQKISAYGISVENIDIPETVLNIEVSGINVIQNYQVDKNNPNYSSDDGILFNKERTHLLDVPSGRQRIEVPKQVEEVNIEQNSIREISFESPVPPVFDITSFDGAKIYVSEENYMAYLIAWGNDLGTNMLLKKDGSESEYIIRDNAILSADGKILYSVTEGVSSAYIVPDGVEVIKSGALEGQTQISVIILPETLKELESNGLSGAGLTDILCQGKVPPKVKADSFGELSGLQVFVDGSARDAYLKAWSPVLGEEETKQLISSGNSSLEEKNGFMFLLKDGEALLLKAPKDLIIFDENSLNGVCITKIGSEAFAGCNELAIVSIPESVKIIEKGAFKGCGELQGAFFCSTDWIQVKEEVFEDCDSLRFVAFNAVTGEIETGYFPGNAAFMPAGAAGYPDSFIEAADTYYMENQGEGKILYGRSEDIAGNGTSSVLLRGTKNISGEIILPEGTVQIGHRALASCTDIFTLNQESMSGLKVISNSAFSMSGLSGEIILPSGLESLEEEAFYMCSHLSKVHIDGTNLAYIKNFAFSSCDNLSEVTFGDQCQVSSLGASVFAFTNIRELYLPESILNIYPDVFYGCGQFERLYLKGSQPPELILYSLGFGYSFGDELPENFRVVLTDESALTAYLEAWKYPMVGRFKGEELTKEEEAQAETILKQLFGINQISLKTLDIESETETDILEETSETALDTETEETDRQEMESRETGMEETNVQETETSQTHLEETDMTETEENLLTEEQEEETL